MAARKQTWHNDAAREKIQTSQLINRLQDSVLGEVKLDTAKLKAIEILLKKSLPDLQSIEHKGDSETPFKMEISWKRSE